MQIHRDRKQIIGFQGLIRGENGNDCLIGIAFFLRQSKCSGTQLWHWSYNNVNVVNVS